MATFRKILRRAHKFSPAGIGNAGALWGYNYFFNPDLDFDIQGDIEVNKVGADKYFPVIYGRRRVGGVRAFYGTRGTNNKYLDIVMVWGEGYIHGSINAGLEVDDLPLNKEKFNPGGSPLITAITYDGGTAQIASADLVSAYAGWTSSHKLSGLCYTHFKLEYREGVFSGIPKFNFTPSYGMRVTDVRTSLNTDLDSYINPANCIYDYLTNTTYGCGVPTSSIDIQSFKDAADYCDVLIDANDNASPVQIRRFECEVFIDTKKKLLDNLKTLLTSCRGMLPRVNGKYYLVIEKDETSTYSFNSGNMLSGVRVTGTSKKNKLNRITARYVKTPLSKHGVFFTGKQQTDFAVFDSPSLRSGEDNGELLEATISLPFETDFYRATMHAETALKKSREGVMCNFSAVMDALQVETAAVVDITDEVMGWVNKKFRVVKMDMASEMRIDFTAREHEASVYNPTIPPEAPVEPDSVLIDPFTVPAITDLTLASGTAQLILSPTSGDMVTQVKGAYTALDNAYLVGYEVEWKLSSASTWISDKDIRDPAIEEFILSPMQDGDIIDVRIRAVNTIPLRSDWYTVSSHPVLGQGEPPPTPVNLLADTQSDGTRQYSWTYDNAPIDFVRGGVFEMRFLETMTLPDWDDMAVLPGAEGIPSSSRLIESNQLPQAIYYIAIKAIDRSGNYSTNASFIYADLGAPRVSDVIKEVNDHPLWVGDIKPRQIATLAPSDVANFDYAGIDGGLSANGKVVLTCAPTHEHTGSGLTDSGAAWVWDRVGDQLINEFELNAGDALSFDKFGHQGLVSDDGNTIFVSAHEQNTDVTDGGAIYVFVRSTTAPGWVQQARLVPTTTPTTGDKVGFSISCDANGDTLVASQPFADDGGTEQGLVQVWTRTGASWSHDATLSAAVGVNFDHLGYNVHLSKDGSTLFAGATGASWTGKVRVFEKPSGGWVDANEDDTITASDGATFDYFGNAVNDTYVFGGTPITSNWDGSVLLVGAHGWEGDTGNFTGAVYYFKRDNVTRVYTEIQIIKEPSGSQDVHWFGYSNSIDDDGVKLLVGASSDDTDVANGGATYIYKYDAGSDSFVEQQRFAEDTPVANSFFGYRVKIDPKGKYAIVCASDHDGGGNDEGRSFLYDLTEGKQNCSIEEGVLVAEIDYDFSDLAPIALTDRSILSTTDVNGLAYLNSEFFAMCDSGEIFISPNKGESWVELTTPVSAKMNAGASDGYERLVFVGDGGTIIYTDNYGTSFTNITSAGITTAALNAIGIYSDLFVAVGDGGVVIKSQDRGATWSSVDVTTSLDLNGVLVLSDGRIVVVAGDSGDTDGRVWTSDDNGGTWTERLNIASHLLGITHNFDTDRLHAVGLANDVYYSDNDGTGWTLQTGLTGNWLDVHSNGVYEIVVGQVGKFMYTKDGGANWTSGTSGTDNINAVVPKAGGKWVLAGNNNKLATSPSGLNYGDLTDFRVPAMYALRYTSTVEDLGAVLPYAPEFDDSFTGRIKRYLRTEDTEADLRALPFTLHTGAAEESRYIQRDTIIYGRTPVYASAQMSISGDEVTEYLNDKDLSGFLTTNTVAQGKELTGTGRYAVPITKAYATITYINPVVQGGGLDDWRVVLDIPKSITEPAFTLLKNNVATDADSALRVDFHVLGA